MTEDDDNKTNMHFTKLQCMYKLLDDSHNNIGLLIQYLFIGKLTIDFEHVHV